MRRRYFIVRPEPNKQCVPMIALDELPPDFRLKGVPLTVNPQQINEWDMARVGADVALKYSFEIEFDHLPVSQQCQPSSHRNEDSPSQEKTQVPAEAVSVTGEVNEEEGVEKPSKPDTSTKSEETSNAETSKAKSNIEGLASVLKLHQEVNVSSPSGS